MNTNRQIFLDDTAAAGTFLTGVSGVHLDECFTSFFSLVIQHPKEFAPTSVKNTLGEFGSNHAADIQFLGGNKRVFRNEQLAQLVKKIFSVVLYLLVGLLEFQHGSCPAIAAPLAAADATACPPQANFQLTVELRGLDAQALGSRHERIKAHIKADGFDDGLLGGRGDSVVNENSGEPFASTANHAEVFDLADDGLEAASTDRLVDAADVDAALNLQHVSALADAERVPSVAALESRITTLLNFGFDAPKESLKRQINAADRIPLHLAGNGGKPPIGRPPLSQMLGLIETTNALLFFTPFIPPLFKASIENVPPLFEIFIELPSLAGIGVQLGFQGSQHKG
jgi:hypothetical protein